MKTRSSKNNNNNNAGGDEQPQLRRSELKRKLNNQLANDGKPAGEKDQPGPEKEECSSKNSRRDGRNDQDLEQIVQMTGDGEKEIADENEKQAEEESELPICQPMKIQMSNETWFDMLEFVGRRQLGKIVPKIGDRRFAGIAQSFLHNYGHITLANICISGPRHRFIQLTAATALPQNVKAFLSISLSYLNTQIINFLQKFQQKSLFGNVNLNLSSNFNSQEKPLLKALSRVLPSIDNINSIRVAIIAQLAGLYNADNEMAKTMLKMARFLVILWVLNDFNFAPNEIAFLNRWLHTPRDDGKPRVLILPFSLDYSDVRSVDKIPHFIDDTIKEEFAKAKLPVCFFIRFFVRDSVDWQDSSMENGETKEKLVIKKVATTETTNGQKMALISRYPLAAGKRWIEANEREAIDWNYYKQNCRISLGTF